MLIYKGLFPIENNFTEHSFLLDKAYVKTVTKLLHKNAGFDKIYNSEK